MEDKENIKPYLDMLAEIEQGYADGFAHVDSEEVFSLISYAKEHGVLTDKQKKRVRNLYTGGR